MNTQDAYRTGVDDGFNIGKTWAAFFINKLKMLVNVQPEIFEEILKEVKQLEP